MYQELAFLILYKKSLKLPKEVIKNCKSIDQKKNKTIRQTMVVKTQQREIKM
jgi:hypothetical protein